VADRWGNLFKHFAARDWHVPRFSQMYVNTFERRHASNLRHHNLSLDGHGKHAG
jgi:hypothetical protein